MKQVTNYIDLKSVWKILVITILFFTAIIPLSAQNKSDTASIKRLLSAAKNYLYTFPDSAEIFLKDAQQQSESIHYNSGLFAVNYYRGNMSLMSEQFNTALHQYSLAEKHLDTVAEYESYAGLLANRGLVYGILYNSESALYFYNRALVIAKEHQMSDLIQKFTMDMGNIYNRKNDYINAVDYLSRAIEMAKTSNDSVSLANMLLSYGLLYDRLKKYDNALFYYKEVLQLNKKLKGIDFKAKTYINIGQAFDKMMKYDCALFYYNEAIKVALPFEKERIRISAIHNIGNIYNARGNYDSAIYYYDEIYQNADLINNPDVFAAVVINLGRAHFVNNNHAKARFYLNKGYRIADSLKVLEYKSKTLPYMIELAKMDRNYKLALDYSEEYLDVMERMNEEMAVHQIAILEFDKEVVRKQYDNAALLKESNYKSTLINNQRSFIWMIIVCLMVVLIFLSIAIRNRKKIKNLHTELSSRHQQLLQSNQALETHRKILNQRKEELKASNAAKDKFVSVIGHDLKGPVGGVNQILQILSNDWAKIKEMEKIKLIDMLKTSSSQTYDLLENLLNWGQASQGVLKPVMNKFELLPLVDSIIEMYASLTEEKGIQIQTNIPATFSLFSDQRFVGQIIQNFINNAIKFSHPGSIVTIALSEANGGTKLCITDKGIGIPADKIVNIFEPDANFNRRGTKNEKSTGVGLMLCKEYSQMLDAKLSVQSEVNMGSTFCLEMNS